MSFQALRSVKATFTVLFFDQLGALEAQLESDVAQQTVFTDCYKAPRMKGVPS